MQVVGHITRGAGLGGGVNLELEDPGTYRVVSFGIGSVGWRRATAISPYQHGEFLVGAVKDVMTGTIVIRCYGSSPSELNSNVDDLLRAFEQFSYQIAMNIDHVGWEWKCECADYRMVDSAGSSEGYDKYAQNALQQSYEFKFPRNPTPLAGAF